MATAVPSAEHGHELDRATRITRARLGVLLLILSDAGFVTATYASQGYLSILNMQHQFRSAGEDPPAILTGAILALVMVASAATYLWGWQRFRAGNLSQYRTGLLIAWVLVLVAFVAQLVVL